MGTDNDKTPGLDRAYALETPDDTLRLYAAWAETYDTDFVDGTGFRFPGLVAKAFLANGGSGPCLDVGCGTGAVADHLPGNVIVDGLDLSPEMLAVAERKNRYRTLIEANLMKPLPLPHAAYNGLLCSGTFTHGHVGGAALIELTRILRPGALAVISVRTDIWDSMGFAKTLSDLVKKGAITPPNSTKELIYSNAERAPKGHANDTAFLTTYQRL